MLNYQVKISQNLGNDGGNLLNYQLETSQY